MQPRLWVKMSARGGGNSLFYEAAILYRWSFTTHNGPWIKYDPPVYRRLMNQRTRVRITLIRMLVVKGK